MARNTMERRLAEAREEWQLVLGGMPNRLRDRMLNQVDRANKVNRERNRQIWNGFKFAADRQIWNEKGEGWVGRSTASNKKGG